MEAPPQVLATAEAGLKGPAVRSQWRMTWRALRRDKAAVVGAIVIALVALAAIFAPWISPYDPNFTFPELRNAEPGTAGHILGLDGQGRDILSRLIWGGRISLPAALLPVLVATAISVILGLFAGYYQGWLGGVIMRIVDIFFAFPMVLLAVAVAGILGPGIVNVMLSISIVLIPYITRVVYTTAVEVSHQEFMEAARAAGARNFNLITEQMLPNVLSPTIVYATTIVGLMIVFASGLSFLGLGIQPPDAEWGVMTADGRGVLPIAPHVATIPGLLILVVALAFNALGDGLRDALDPHLRAR